MTAIELLQERGPMHATHIAAVLGVAVVEVYGQLVRAYDQELVRINPGREWEAMEETPA